jgi:hypothetical protein
MERSHEDQPGEATGEKFFQFFTAFRVYRAVGNNGFD